VNGYTDSTPIRQARLSRIEMRGLSFGAFAAALLMGGTLADCAPAAASDVSPNVRAAIESTRAQLRAGRTQYFAENLPLTQEQADRFWPLFREYDTKRAALGNERIAILAEYAGSYPNLSDAEAAQLVARSIKWEREATELRIEYADKFGKVLPPATLLRFLQIDRRVDTMIEVEFQRVMPLANPAAK
jgi:Spy/CpxP family protein refolding chaperone